MPKVYQELDPEVAAKAIEGYDDVLTDEATKLEAFYAQHRCPRCGGACAKHFISVEHAFSPNSDTPLPRSGLRCMRCDFTFDPHSGLAVSLGTDVEEVIERVRSGSGSS